MVKKCTASLLLSALLCFTTPPLLVLRVTSRKACRQGGRGGVEATEQQSKSDDQGISPKWNFASSTGVLQFGDMCAMHRWRLRAGVAG